MSQTQPYDFNQRVANAGQLADIGPKVINSFAVELEGTGFTEASFGLPVKRGTNAEKECTLITDLVNDVFLGVLVRQHTNEQGYDPSQTPASTGAPYKDGDAASVLLDGCIFVEVHGECTAGDQVFIKLVNGKGVFVGGLDSNENSIGPVGKYETTLATGDLDINGVGIAQAHIVFIP